jgi:hypothetical protein
MIENLTPGEWRFSIFHDPNKGRYATKPNGTISLKRLIEIYSSETLITISKQLSEAPTPEERDALKMRLPFITPSGSFTYRNSGSIVAYNSTLLPLDIDNLDPIDAVALRDFLTKIDGCVASILSPRKKGVKALFYIEQRIPFENRFQWLKTNKNNICDHLGLDLIADLVDVSQWATPQAFFLANDPDGFFNPEAIPFSIDWVPYVEPIVSRPSAMTSFDGTNPRVDQYMTNATNRLIEFFALCGEGERHRNIVKVKPIASWMHYTPHLENEIREKLLTSVVSMYGTHKQAISNGAIKSFNECWDTPPQPNPTIEGIIYELFNA